MRVTLLNGVALMIGAGLLVTAAFLYQDSGHVRTKHVGMPLRMLLPLTPGEIETPEFVADKGSYYVIEIAPHEGYIDSRKTDISWTISEHGRTIAQGDSSHIWGNESEQIIGSLRPEHGGLYKLHLSVRSLVGKFGADPPELRVILDPGERDDIAMGAGFLELGAEICGVLGLVALTLATVTIVRSRRIARAA